MMATAAIMAREDDGGDDVDVGRVEVEACESACGCWC